MGESLAGLIDYLVADEVLSQYITFVHVEVGAGMPRHLDIIMDILPAAHVIHVVLQGNGCHILSSPSRSHPALRGLDSVCSKVNQKAAEAYLHIASGCPDATGLVPLGPGFSAFASMFRHYLSYVDRDNCPNLKVVQCDWVDRLKLVDKQHVSVDNYPEMVESMFRFLFLADKGLRVLNWYELGPSCARARKWISRPNRTHNGASGSSSEKRKAENSDGAEQQKGDK